MAVPFNTVGSYATPSNDKSQLTSAAVGYTDPVLGIPLNTATDFLWAVLVELRKMNVLLQAGLNVQDNIDLYNTDPSVVPQSTGTQPNFQ